MQKKYALVTMCDETYIIPTLVFLYTFVKNNKWFNGDLFIIPIGEISMESFNRIKNIYQNAIIMNANACNIKRNDCNWEYKFNSMTSKFEIFLIEGYDRVVYIDCDTIITNDISDLFLCENEFAVCADKVDKSFNKISTSVKRTNEYFNSGVISLDGNICNNHIYNEIIDMYVNFDYVYSNIPNSFNGKFQDQDILNEYFHNKDCVLLPNTYNMPQYFYNDNAKIIHYLGHEKPWAYMNLCNGQSFNESLPYTKTWINEYEEMIESQ